MHTYVSIKHMSACKSRNHTLSLFYFIYSFLSLVVRFLCVTEAIDVVKREIAAKNADKQHKWILKNRKQCKEKERTKNLGEKK